MKKLITLGLILLAAPVTLLASGAGLHLDKADIDLSNKASLQRGFKYFMNYCSGCHSIGLTRYSRVGADLGIPKEVLKSEVVFARDEKGDPVKVGSYIKASMRKSYADEAFGKTPPDLSVVARARGSDWIYTYLRGFYLDPSRPTGVNNTAFDKVGMPHVLWELQGWQALKKGDEHAHGEGHGVHVPDELVLVSPGSVPPVQYDQIVRDITNFLTYLAEPVREKRLQTGVFVMLFLFIFFVAAYFLKKEYWKDVH